MKKKRSWKTTVAAILAVLPQVLHLFFPAKISSDQAAALSTLAAAAGLASAKDHNVTGAK